MVSTWKACDSLLLSILLLSDWPSNSEGRDGILDLRHHGLWLPLEMGLYRTPHPWEADPTHLRNRELGPMSGFWDLLCTNVNGPGKGEGDGMLWGMPCIRACTMCHLSISTTSWPEIVRLPYNQTMTIETKVIRVGTMKGITGKLGDLPGVFPSLELGGWIWLRGKGSFPVFEGHSPPTTSFWVLGHKGHSSMSLGGFALPPCSTWSNRPLFGGWHHSCSFSASGTWGHLQLRTSS